jgi:hypothetical protein
MEQKYLRKIAKKLKIKNLKLRAHMQIKEPRIVEPTKALTSSSYSWNRSTGYIFTAFKKLRRANVKLKITKITRTLYSRKRLSTFVYGNLETLSSKAI